MLKKVPSSKIQDDFLSYAIDNKINVRVFLANGIKLEGNITHFDDYSFVLNNVIREDSYPILVYKNAISTVSPEGNVVLK